MRCRGLGQEFAFGKSSHQREGPLTADTIYNPRQTLFAFETLRAASLTAADNLHDVTPLAVRPAVVFFSARLFW